MLEKEITLGIIPAREGSKGVTGKNIRMLGGKPLIAHAIECGRRCSGLDRIVVSTDSETIAAIAKKYGAEVPFLRPAELAEDTTPMLPVLEHALLECERKYGQKIRAVVLVDPTAPLRTPEDIEGALRLFDESGCSAVVSGNEAHRNPYFNMVKEENGEVRLVNKGDKSFGRRQDAPQVYDLNTVVWIYSRKAILEEKRRLPEKSRLYLVPKERSLDLDTEFDFKLLEFFLK